MKLDQESPASLRQRSNALYIPGKIPAGSLQLPYISRRVDGYIQRLSCTFERQMLHLQKQHPCPICRPPILSRWLQQLCDNLWKGVALWLQQMMRHYAKNSMFAVWKLVSIFSDLLHRVLLCIQLAVSQRTRATLVAIVKHEKQLKVPVETQYHLTLNDLKPATITRIWWWYSLY